MVMAPFLNTTALAAVFAVLHPLYKKLKKPLFNSSGLAASPHSCWAVSWCSFRLELLEPWW